MGLKLYAVNDVGGELINVSDALEKSPDIEMTFSGIEVQDGERWQEAFEKIKNFTGDFSLLLDLKFRTAGESIWPEVKSKFDAVLVNDEPRLSWQKNGLLRGFVDDRKFELSTQLDGLGLILAVLENTNPGKTLVYTASTIGKDRNVDRFLQKVKVIHARRNSYRQMEALHDPEAEFPEDVTDAKNIIARLYEQWHLEFPNFHDDPWVSDAIKKWIGCYRGLAEKNKGTDFCTHEHIGCTGAALMYSELANNIFGGADTDCIDGEANLKALFRLRYPENATSKGKGCRNGWFETWVSTNPNRAVKKMDCACSESVLRNIFDMSVCIHGEEHSFPLEPGFPFLICLRLLAQQLRAENKGIGILDAKSSIVLQGQEGGYLLSIPLKQDGEYFGLAKRWAYKIETGGEEIREDGVCGSLWQTLMARVDGVRSPNVSNEESELIALFNGPGRPVCGVSFAPHYIHLHWI